jgi:hypothetical protein
MTVGGARRRARFWQAKRAAAVEPRVGGFGAASEAEQFVEERPEEDMFRGASSASTDGSDGGTAVEDASATAAAATRGT